MSEFKPQSVADPLPQPVGQRNSFNLPPEMVSPPGGSFGNPTPSRFGQFYKDNKWYILASLLGLLIIGVLAFFAFRKQEAEPVAKANVDVNIDAPSTAPAGGEVVYKIQINNNDPSKLVGMNLELVYDSGMSYITSTPPSVNPSGTQFAVKDLANGQNVVLMVKVAVTGDLNTDKKLVARLHYKFANFSSEFVQEAESSVRLVASDIVLDVAGPEKTTGMQTASYDIYYRNDSNKDINGARIEVIYPNEFTYKTSTPNPSLGQNIWNITSLPRNGTGKISFSGDFAKATAGQSVVFKVAFSALDSDGRYFNQASTTYMTTIESQPISVQQKWSNPTQKDLVDSGATVQVDVIYKNNTQVPANGVNISVVIDSSAIDTSKITAEKGLVNGNTINWNASGVPELASLPPGVSGTIRYSFVVNKPANKDNSKNLTIKTTAKVKSNENSEYLIGNDLALKVTSPAEIGTSVAVISGPVPLRVGQTTVLQLSVSLRNSSNDFREGVLTAFVPLGAVFDKTSVTTSELSATNFDTATGKLTWNVGQLLANSGSAIPLRTLKFNLVVTPTVNMTNQSIPLLKTLNFTGKDSFTEQSIAIQASDVTSANLPGGDGAVKP